MIPFSPNTSLCAAATALDLVTFFVLAFISVLQFCFVRRHGDAARTWVKWSRYSLALFTFTMFVLCGKSVIATVYNRFTDRHIDFFASEKRGLFQARGFLDNIWWLCEAVVRVLLLVTFAMLGAGLAMARSTAAGADASLAAPAGWTKMPAVAGGAGTLTLLLALPLFGLRCYFWAHFYDGRDQEQGLVQGRAAAAAADGSEPQANRPGVDLAMINRVASDMDFALQCIWLVLSLLVLVLAVRTRSLSRSAPHTKTASKYFLTCAILFVAQPLYDIILYIIFYFNTSYVPDVQATVVTDVFFRMWPHALILILLFVLGRNKIGGVWSTQQPFQTKDAAAGETVYQTPWGYQVTHKTAPAVPQHQAPEYDAQAQLNQYYAQPQQGAPDMQQQYHQQQYQQQQYQQQQHQYQQQQQPHYT